MEFYIIIFAIIAIVWMYSWLREELSNSKKYRELKPKLDNLERDRRLHNLKVSTDRENWISKVKKWNEQVARTKEEIKKISRQKSMGFPWLAHAYADYFTLKDGKLKKYLEFKKRPALKTAQLVSEIKQEKRKLLFKNRVLEYKIDYIGNLFPWVYDLITENEDDEVLVEMHQDDSFEANNSGDGSKKFLTQDEYRKLPSVERNQLALDRYLKNRKKSKWAIGRDYEMYVGYLYSKMGYSINYTGIVDGFDDLGRDVIAKKGDETLIIQCKRWAQWKEMREKHIFQLFGTTMEYWIKNFKNKNTEKSFAEFSNFLNEDRLRPIFFTSTSLSERAREMADTLSIEIIENEPIGEFPRIKCNINKDENGDETKIYHLPMDQQYDRTIIGDRKGEFHAFTVKEAEDAGFRRAYRHTFSK